MALVLKSTVTVLDGCYGFSFIDSTGDYSVDNPGGYGGPNIDAIDVATSTISVYPPNSTIPYVFYFEWDKFFPYNYTLATLTKPDGTIVDILADVSSLSFPFSVGNEFIIKGTYLDYESETSIIDGAWTINYEIVDESENIYMTNSYQLITCGACCCIQKLFINLPDCGCDDGYFRTAQLADAYLKSAIYSANMGFMERAQKNIDKANEICSGNCKSC
jgi:hypothetical protein